MWKWNEVSVNEANKCFSRGKFPGELAKNCSFFFILCNRSFYSYYLGNLLCSEHKLCNWIGTMLCYIIIFSNGGWKAGIRLKLRLSYNNKLTCVTFNFLLFRLPLSINKHQHLLTANSCVALLQTKIP